MDRPNATPQWPPAQPSFTTPNPDATRSINGDAGYQTPLNANAGQRLGYDPTWQPGYGDGYANMGQVNPPTGYADNVYQGELPPQEAYPGYPNYPPTQGYGTPYQTPQQWGRQLTTTDSLTLVISFISIAVMAVVGLLFARYTGYWWLAVVFPTIGLLRLLAGGGRRTGYVSAGYAVSRLISLLITLAIFAGIFYAIICNIGGLKF